jgi:Competence protein J (ComJ)
MARFTVEVSYTQIAVFDQQLPNPFNDWTDAHVAQGFAWRPGSVSFGTLESAGPLSVQVLRGTHFDETVSDAERVIAVPYSVPAHGWIEVGSIGGGVGLDIPPGEYQLIFEHGRDQTGDMWATLYFMPVHQLVKPRIIRADRELTPPAVYSMSAEPA